MYQLRQDGKTYWLFLAHCSKPENQDIPCTDPFYRVRLRGTYCVEAYDTLSGKVTPVFTSRENGWTLLETQLYEHDSLLLRLSVFSGDIRPVQPQAMYHTVSQQVFLDAVPVTLHEPNVLLLDMPEYALDGEALRPADEILRLDNVLRSELGWPLRGDSVAQPWVGQDDSTPHMLRLRYTFESEEPVTGVKLALEHALDTNVSLNGLPAGEASGWYADKCMKTVSLPDIQAGRNILELAFPYGRKVDVEACFLLGDFGVSVRGCRCTLTKPVSELAFGDITRQGLPFYGGNLTYHLELEAVGDQLEIQVSYFRCHLLQVLLDGEDNGIITFSPYRLKAEDLKPGRHRLDLVCYGSRINTFGQLHRNDRYNQWWGPDSWRSSGASWTWEYRLWEQGILKSPEIKDFKKSPVPTE